MYTNTWARGRRRDERARTAEAGPGVRPGVRLRDPVRARGRG